MKKLAITSTIVLGTIVSTPVFAETTRASVQDHYRTVTRTIPHNEKVCSTVDIPIYGTTSKKNNTDDMIIGGIIGGIIGNQVGKGGGKEAATGIGALTGAIIAGNNGKEQTIIGYRQEQRCQVETTYTTKSEEVYDYSTITFKEDGRRYVIRFQK